MPWNFHRFFIAAKMNERKREKKYFSLAQMASVSNSFRFVSVCVSMRMVSISRVNFYDCLDRQKSNFGSLRSSSSPPTAYFFYIRICLR